MAVTSSELSFPEEFSDSSALYFYSDAGYSSKGQGPSPSKQPRVSPPETSINRELAREALGVQNSHVVSSDATIDKGISGEALDTPEEAVTPAQTTVAPSVDRKTARPAINSSKPEEKRHNKSSVAEGWSELPELAQRPQAGIKIHIERTQDLEAALKSITDTLEATKDMLQLTAQDTKRAHSSHVMEKARADVAQKACDGALKESFALRNKVEGLEDKTQVVEKVRDSALTERDKLRDQVQSLAGSIREIEKERDSVINERDDLQSQVEGLEEHVRETEKARDTAIAETDGLRTQVTNLEMGKQVAEHGWNNEIAVNHELQTRVTRQLEGIQALEGSVAHFMGLWQTAEARANTADLLLQQSRQREEEKDKVKDQAIKERGERLKAVTQGKDATILEKSRNLKPRTRCTHS